jgi:hypothetical protein
MGIDQEVEILLLLILFMDWWQTREDCLRLKAAPNSADLRSSKGKVQAGEGNLKHYHATNLQHDFGAKSPHFLQ